MARKKVLIEIYETDAGVGIKSKITVSINKALQIIGHLKLLETEIVKLIEEQRKEK